MRPTLIFLIFALVLAAAGCDDEGSGFPERAGSPERADSPERDLGAGSPEDAVDLADRAAARAAIDEAMPDFSATRNVFGVRSVVDGDTIILDDGRRIRYIGIDAPERAESAEGREHAAEPYCDEATEFNRRLVEGRRVLLVFDKERTDIYGRTLAYVFALPEQGEGRAKFANAEMVLGGFALAIRYPPNLAHAEMLTGLEELAAREKSGLWRTTPSGYVGSANSKIFHRSACPYGRKIKPQNAVFFATCRQARLADYRPCRVCRP